MPSPENETSPTALLHQPPEEELHFDFFGGEGNAVAVPADNDHDGAVRELLKLITEETRRVAELQLPETDACDHSPPRAYQKASAAVAVDVVNNVGGYGKYGQPASLLEEVRATNSRKGRRTRCFEPAVG